MRLKSLLFSLFMLAGFSMAQATVVEIGTANSDMISYLPTHYNWNYSISQQIYQHWEIGESRPIHSISFYNGTANGYIRNIKLYLSVGDSSYGSAQWKSVTAADQVFAGNVYFTPNNWTTITQVIILP